MPGTRSDARAVTAGGRKSPALAALLSFILPGLGQLYVGRPRRALLFLVPALVVWLVLVAALASGWRTTFGLLVQPTVLNTLLVVNVLLLLVHGVAVIDAWSLARRRSGRRGIGAVALAGLVVALAATVVLHGVPGWYGYSLAVSLPRYLNLGPQTGIPTPSWLASPSPAVPATPAHSPTAGPTVTPSLAPSPPPSPTASPPPTPFGGREWAADGRLDVLLLGTDAGPARWSARPDAIHVLSVDIETGDAAIFAFPRYTSNIPVPPETAHMFKDGRYPGFLNEFYVAALNNPRRFPYNDDAGWGVMAGVVQELSGVPIDGYAVIDLLGFERMVDELGGLWVEVPPPGVVDSRYGLGTGRSVSLRIAAGCHELDGRRTLFFSRTRRQDSDIHRLARQLVTIQSLRRQYDPLEVLPRLPDIFAAGGDAFHTSFGPDDLLPLAEVLARVDPERVRTVIFSPPDYPRNLHDDTVERIHATVRGIFDEPRPPAVPTECPPD